MEERTKKNTSRLAKNYLYNLVYHLFTIITPLITTPYISRVLGAENIGIYGYVESVCLYFIVMGNMGFPLYGQREIAYNANDKRKRSERFAEIMAGKTFFLLIAVFLYFGYVTLFTHANKIIFYSYLLGMFADVINIGWYYQGVENFRTIVVRNFVIKIASVVSIFLFVKTENDLLKYSLLINAANVLGNGLVIFGLRKQLDLKGIRLRAKAVFRHTKPAFILAIPYYITSVYAVIDKTMIGAICGSYSEVGFYEQSQKIVTFALAIVTAMGVVFLPRIANEVAGKNKEEVRYYLNKGLEVIILLALPIMAGLLCVGDMIVPWFFGKGYEKVGTLILIFAPQALIMGLSNFAGNQYLVAVKREKQLTVAIAVGAAVNVVMNFILIHFYASFGAAAATVFSEFCKLVLLGYYIRNDVSKKELAAAFIRYLIPSAAMFAAGFALKTLVFTQYTLVNTLVIACVCVVLYFAILLIMKNRIVYAVLGRVFHKKK